MWTYLETTRSIATSMWMAAIIGRIFWPVLSAGGAFIVLWLMRIESVDSVVRGSIERGHVGRARRKAWLL